MGAQEPTSSSQGNGHRPGIVDRVVVPVEGSAQELVAQEWAVEYASALNAPLRVVHIATGAQDPPEDVFDYVRGLCDRNGVELEVHVLHARDVAEELVDELAPSDLAIIGTRLLGTEYSTGSITEALIRQAPCPVQVIRLE